MPGWEEEMDSNMVIHPGLRGDVDRYGNLPIGIDRSACARTSPFGRAALRT